MRRLILLFLVAGLMVGLVAVSHLSLRPKRAQADGREDQGGCRRCHRTGEAGTVRLGPGRASETVSFPVRPAHAAGRCRQQLSRELGLPVVLDLAALDRLDVKPEDTVKLELQGVRLKTGLKLLLDQVGLTYKVVAEDNLLILTDKQGSEDPIERVMAEIHELHRDIHDIQDALDEVRELTGLTGAEGAQVRKPTIIEEMPENQDGKPQEGATSKPSTRPEPGSKPQGLPSARPRTSL